MFHSPLQLLFRIFFWFLQVFNDLFSKYIQSGIKVLVNKSLIFVRF